MSDEKNETPKKKQVWWDDKSWGITGFLVLMVGFIASFYGLIPLVALCHFSSFGFAAKALDVNDGDKWAIVTIVIAVILVFFYFPFIFD